MVQVEADLGLPAAQVLALFAKAIRRLHGHLRAAKEAEVARVLPRAAPALAGGEALAPHEADLDQELDEAARVSAACFLLCFLWRWRLGGRLAVESVGQSVDWLRGWVVV